ncbi:hypothetical protein J132_11085 [Termitomyces sp. J132]|nr:hypothetical protein J132_11085 [Termitomyces sp. J132]
MKLHPSAPIVLGFSWLRFTNSHIDWPSLILCLDWDNPTNSGLVPFDVSPPSENPKSVIDQSWTPPQLCLRSAWLFVINVRPNGLPQVLPTLVNSGTSSAFISSQLNLQHNDLNKPLKLQLFDRSPAMTGVTQYYDNTLTLNNDLWFQAWLLITQLPPLTPIMLRLLWMHLGVELQFCEDEYCWGLILQTLYGGEEVQGTGSLTSVTMER